MFNMNFADDWIWTADRIDVGSNRFCKTFSIEPDRRGVKIEPR